VGKQAMIAKANSPTPCDPPGYECSGQILPAKSEKCRGSEYMKCRNEKYRIPINLFRR
jgi:hypothetical protein